MSAVTTTVLQHRHWLRRNALVLFWAVTAPLVFQGTYTLMDGSSGGPASTYSVAATYLSVQGWYALLLIGLVRLRRAYWAWIARI